MKILLRILTITSFVSSCFAYNMETRKTFSLHLRHGGDKLEDNQEPAYAGYNFVVSHNDDDTVSIIVGQPRSGEPNQTVSNGSLYHCNFKYLNEMDEADIVTKSPATESATSTSMTTSADNDTSMETTTSSKGLVTTAMPEFSIHNCTKLKIFDWTNPNHRDLDHKQHADALGLSLIRIENSTDYAACTPLRHRICPSSVSHTPGACYVGNLKNNHWTFMKWEETRCFKDIIEIIFVVDGSGSIGYANFTKVKDWLINVTESLFDEFKETVRTEVLQYSNKDRSRDRVPIEDSTKFEIPYTLNEVITIDTITNRIRKMKYLNSQTYTYYALRRAMEVEFPRSDFYDSSKKIIVVLTDGAANDRGSLTQWYEYYKDTVTTFAIGVGDFTKFIVDLNNIANGGKSLDERVLKVENFGALQKVITKITSEIKSTSTESSTIDVDTTAQDSGSIQLGMSIVSSKNGVLYLGAVGSYGDSGTVMKYDDVDDTIPDIPSYSHIQDALPNQTPDSYMGYATVIGYFDGMTSDYYVATGAPRYMLVGAVVVYKHARNDSIWNNRLTIMLSPSKCQVAEYYGGSLLALDVSGDGKDDLFVGAPLNSGNKYDEGRVFVYISQDSNTTQTWESFSYSPLELYGSRLTAGRFGTAIANAGDINLDGFNDVVIGSPLADDSRGAVYIYHGKKGGIETTFGQEIRASKFTDATPKYFGNFLQGNIDIDKNKYPDIFVGAPRTDSVVILRSRPIVKIYVTMNFTTPSIDLFECIKKQYEKCTSINICFLANGTSVGSEIDVRYNITLDTAKTNLENKRVQFFNNGSADKYINIKDGKRQCFSHWINMKKKIDDFETIIAADLEFDLLDSHLAKPLSSVRDPSETNKKSTKIYIEKGCKSKICRHDLRLDVKLCLPEFIIKTYNSTKDHADNGTMIVIDSSTSSVPTTVKVNTSNDGEKTFQTTNQVTYTSPPLIITTDNSTKDYTDNRTVLVIDSSTSSVSTTVKVNTSNNVEKAFQTANQVTYTSPPFIITTDNSTKDHADNGTMIVIDSSTSSVSTTVKVNTSNNVEKAFQTTNQVTYTSPPFIITTDNSTKDCNDNGKVLVIDSSTSSVPATVKVNMSNNGEKAFQTAINVTYTSQISLSKLDRLSAYPASNSCIVEDGIPVDNGNGSKTQVFRYNTEEYIVMSNTWCYFEFNLETKGLKNLGTLGLLTVNITAYTSSFSSREIDSSDNSRYISTKIRYRSDFLLKKESSNAEIAFNHTRNGIVYPLKSSNANITFNYTSNVKNITSVQEIGDSTPDVRMDFRLTGAGFSIIPISDIVLTWPAMSAAGNPLLYLYKIQCNYQGSSIKNDTTCTCDDSKVNSLNLTVDGAAENETSVTTTVSLTNVSFGVSEIDCTADDSLNNSRCETLKCTVTNLGASDKVYFEALFRLWTPSIYLKDLNYTRLKSGFKVSTSRSPFIMNKDGSYSTTTMEEVITTAKGMTGIGPVEDNTTLTVILSAAGAFCILAVVIVILWKQGFFENKYAAKMKEAEDDAAEEDNAEIEPVEKIIDNDQN